MLEKHLRLKRTVKMSHKHPVGLVIVVELEPVRYIDKQEHTHRQTDVETHTHRHTETNRDGEKTNAEKVTQACIATALLLGWKLTLYEVSGLRHAHIRREIGKRHCSRL